MSVPLPTSLKRSVVEAMGPKRTAAAYQAPSGPRPAGFCHRPCAANPASVFRRQHGGMSSLREAQSTQAPADTCRSSSWRRTSILLTRAASHPRPLADRPRSSARTFSTEHQLHQPAPSTLDAGHPDGAPLLLLLLLLLFRTLLCPVQPRQHAAQPGSSRSRTPAQHASLPHLLGSALALSRNLPTPGPSFPASKLSTAPPYVRLPTLPTRTAEASFRSRNLSCSEALGVIDGQRLHSTARGR